MRTIETARGQAVVAESPLETKILRTLFADGKVEPREMTLYVPGRGADWFVSLLNDEPDQDDRGRFRAIGVAPMREGTNPFATDSLPLWVTPIADYSHDVSFDISVRE